MKSVDKQRIQGYIHESKMFLGSAFTIYLNRLLFLCKALQEDEVCVVCAAEALIKAVKSLTH